MEVTPAGSRNDGSRRALDVPRACRASPPDAGTLPAKPSPAFGHPLPKAEGQLARRLVLRILQVFGIFGVYSVPN